MGWFGRERRFVVLRERVREDRDSVGRKLIDVPGYTFRIFVTSCPEAPEEIWRDYKLHCGMEARPGGRRLLLERILRHRGGLPRNFAAVQPAG